MKSVILNQDKSMNKTSVSAASTDWQIQSILIKSGLLIFIDWLLQEDKMWGVAGLGPFELLL